MAENENSKDNEQAAEVQQRARAAEPGPQEPQRVPSAMGATFAERASAREGGEGKAVSAGDEENKAVSGEETKQRGGARRR